MLMPNAFLTHEWAPVGSMREFTCGRGGTGTPNHLRQAQTWPVQFLRVVLYQVHLGVPVLPEISP